jgi:outer membrane protein W
MKKLTVGCVAFAAVSAFSGAAAAEGFELGARLGYGIPMGDAVGAPEGGEATALGDIYKSQIPIWIDAGYRINENIFAGIYFAYGIAQVDSEEECDAAGADCSGSDMRFGIQGQYHISPAESMDPWFGLGIGYEIAKMKAEAAGMEATQTLSGFEFLNLQGGLDFQAAEGIGVGPFLSFSLGQYSKVKAEVPVLGEVDEDIEDKGLHEWLVLGVRGSFQL